MLSVDCISISGRICFCFCDSLCKPEKNVLIHTCSRSDGGNLPKNGEIKIQSMNLAINLFRHLIIVVCKEIS